MLARRAPDAVNGSASVVLVKPFLIMAARMLGPGPTRLRLIKLAHNLGDGGVVAESPRGNHDGHEGPAVQPTRRAA
jgi:hypothetical protein